MAELVCMETVEEEEAEDMDVDLVKV